MYMMIYVNLYLYLMFFDARNLWFSQCFPLIFMIKWGEKAFSTELFLFRLEQRVATALNLQRTAQARWAKVGSVAIFVVE